MLLPDSSEDDLFRFVRDWFRILSVPDPESACRLIDEPNCYGIYWTPEKLQECLDSAFPSECRFRRKHPEGPIFSDPDTAVGKLHADAVPFDDSSGYSVYFDVPLNGKWSDLTAQFEFCRRTRGLAVILHDLHVL